MSNTEYNRAWRERNPIKARENNRRAAKKFRKVHKEKWNKYYSAYMREYYKQHKLVHYMRSIPSCIREGYANGRKFGKEFKYIFDNLVNIGWDPEGFYDGTRVNHIVSLSIIAQVCPNMSKYIAFDRLNIELTTHSENSSAKKREVNNDVLIIATKLENKYPSELKGLTVLVKSLLGKII